MVIFLIQLFLFSLSPVQATVKTFCFSLHDIAGSCPFFAVSSANISIHAWLFLFFSRLLSSFSWPCTNLQLIFLTPFQTLSHSRIHSRIQEIMFFSCLKSLPYFPVNSMVSYKLFCSFSQIPSWPLFFHLGSSLETLWFPSCFQ